jgi:hypothetical protein
MRLGLGRVRLGYVVQLEVGNKSFGESLQCGSRQNDGRHCGSWQNDCRNCGSRQYDIVTIVEVDKMTWSQLWKLAIWHGHNCGSRQNDSRNCVSWQNGCQNCGSKQNDGRHCGSRLKNVAPNSLHSLRGCRSRKKVCINIAIPTLMVAYTKLIRRIFHSQLKYNQGDQIGQIFAQCVIVYSGQFVENYRSSPNCWATFSTIKVMH